jgi:thioredoxin 1
MHMRIILACAVVFLVPPAIIFGVKQFQAPQSAEPATVSQRPPRGEVLFFNASWCGPCKKMKPIVTQMKREGYHVHDVNVDSNRALAQKYKIRGIPTFVFIENGSEVRRFSGGTSESQLKKLCSAPGYH